MNPSASRLVKPFARPKTLPVSLRFLYSPRWLYLIVGGGAGLFCALLTPPFQVADEFFHFARVYQLSQGEIIAPQQPATGYAGGRIPSSFRQAYAATTAGIEFKPDQKTSLAKTRAALEIALRPDDETFEPFRSALYTPVPYVPQVLGVAVARLFEAPALLHLYLARGFALAAALALGWWTLKALPFFQWPILLLVLMPMTLFQTASASADSFTTALSFALFACIARASVSNSPILRGEKTRLIALVVLVALCKQIYFLLAPLLFLLPARRFGGRKERVVFLGAAFVGALGAVVGWSLMISHLLTAPAPDMSVDVPRQLGLVLADPISFARILVLNYAAIGGDYYRGFIGVLGWLDTFLPDLLHALYGAALIAVALADGGRDFLIEAPRRFLLWGMALGIAVLIPLAAYLAFTPVGEQRILGVQGRYFIPFAPVVLLTLYNRKLAGLVKPPLMAALVGLFLVGVWAQTADAVISRYYGGIGRLMGWI